VWDSDSQSLQSGLAIHVSAGKIVAVGPPQSIPAHIKRIDVGGLSILPGLIDVHVHTEDWHGLFFLARGVTTVRDTGCALDEILDRRQRWNAPGSLSPRLLCCGPLIDGPEVSWTPMSVVVRTPEEARRQVDRLVEAGVDQIKLYAHLEWPCFLAAVQQAKHHDKHTVVHLQDHGNARRAIVAGADEIEHLSGCAEALWPDRHAQGHHWRELWPDLTHERVQRLLDLIVERKTWMAVTRAVWHKIGTVWDVRHAEHCQSRYVPATLRAWWEQTYPANVPDALRWEWIRALAGMQVFTTGLIERGARIIAGTDVPFVHLMPGFSLHDELAMLVACGMKPAQALDAATRQAAQALGIGDQAGTIAAGKAADLVLVEGDPTQDIRLLAGIKRVVRAGRLLDAQQLLAQAAEQTATMAPRTTRRFSDFY
jgi:imidazolonepropionase-like amidohydrolase